MKKIISVVIVLVCSVMLLQKNDINVYASSVSVYASSSVVSSAGETVSIEMSISDPNGMIEANISTSGNVSVNTSSVASMSSSASVIVTVNGSGSVTVSGFAADIDMNKHPINSTFNFSVASSGGGNSSGNGGSSGGSSGGSNQGGSEAPSKTPEELQAEAEQAEKERKEEIAKSLLVESIDIVSSDTKLYGETLKTIKIEEGKTEYEYTLPKRVNKFLLDVASTSGDVTLTYDKEYEFKEDVKEHVITIRGAQEDVVKEYKLTLKQNLDEPTVVKMEDQDVTVYEDELLDRYMDKIGLKKTEIKIGDQKINGFGNDNLKAMLTLVDGEASWRLFNKDDEFLGDAVMMLQSEKEPFFIHSTTNGRDHEKVNKATYVDHTLELDKKILEIDPDLNFKETYKAWDLENESQLIYGVNAKGKQGFYNLDTEKNIEWSIVGFDHVDNAYVTATWGLSGALAVVSSGLIASILERKGLLKFKKK
ncbi:hypothetical protein NBX27_03190 [Erysipelothrix rhusiopathiae]|uniref:hypothetical protein n=3 Tax=Erysipelothrix rhusiopathiae TaxID=1648 RepID=UPI00202B1348|nr:hypothetical protein [Erysipelothrix rhusiopathiae]URQ77881.1 hypothetical protein NBX27_03190 [Erysipelothrix rhusiopathiae]